MHFGRALNARLLYYWRPKHNHYVLVMYLRPLCVYPDCARNMPWTFAAVQMVQARTRSALGVFICIMSDAFNKTSLFRNNNVFQNSWALRAFAKWCAVMRLLNRHSKEATDLQVAKLPNSACYALASMLCSGARLKKNKRGHRDRRCASSVQKLRAPPDAEAEHGPRGRLRASFLCGRIMLPLAQKARDLAIDFHHETIGGALLPCSL